MRFNRFGAVSLAAAALAATAAMAGDGRPAPTPEMRAELFVEADVDQNGVLSVTELQAVPEIMKRRFAEKRLAEIDTDGDGAISQAEFLAAPPPRHRGGGCKGGPHPEPQG